MKQDEIIEMAKQSGFNLEFDNYVYEHWYKFLAFAKLVAQHERERLAQEARECGGVLTVGAILSRGEA